MKRATRSAIRSGAPCCGASWPAPASSSSTAPSTRLASSRNGTTLAAASCVLIEAADGSSGAVARERVRELRDLLVLAQVCLQQRLHAPPPLIFDRQSQNQLHVRKRHPCEHRRPIPGLLDEAREGAARIACGQR